MMIKSPCRLRLKRFMQGLSQVELSKLSGVGQVTLSRIELGVRQAKPEEKVAIAKALKLRVADLFTTRETGCENL